MPITLSVAILIKIAINILTKFFILVKISFVSFYAYVFTKIIYLSNLMDILDKFESKTTESFILSSFFTLLFVYFVSSKLETMEG